MFAWKPYGFVTTICIDSSHWVKPEVEERPGRARPLHEQIEVSPFGSQCLKARRHVAEIVLIRDRSCSSAELIGPPKPCSAAAGRPKREIWSIVGRHSCQEGRRSVQTTPYCTIPRLINPRYFAKTCKPSFLSIQSVATTLHQLLALRLDSEGSH
jgi:hypothetical protein